VGVGVWVEVGVGVGVWVWVGVGVGVGVEVDVGVGVGVSVGVGVCVDVAVGLGEAVYVGVNVGVLKPAILAMTPRPVSPSEFCVASPVRQYAALSNNAMSGKSASATHRDFDLLCKASSLSTDSGLYKIPQLAGTVKMRLTRCQKSVSLDQTAIRASPRSAPVAIASGGRESPCQPPGLLPCSTEPCIYHYPYRIARKKRILDSAPDL
jgi:hypothetical protein